MKVLVTGATGRIGSRLVPRLVENGYEVRALLRQGSRPVPFDGRGAEVVPGDLLQPETLIRAAAGMDAIVHLAAFFRGASEAEAQATNLDGTLALARAARMAHVPRFLFASTGLVYGPGRGRPIREDDEPQPAAGRFYPVSKLAAERVLVQCFQEEQTALCILRLGFVYGPGDPHLREVVSLAKTWPAAKRLHMVHHADVAQAVMSSLEQVQAGGQTYNVADDEPVAIGKIREWNGLAPDAAQAAPLDDPWEGILDTTKIKSELGFRPRYPSFSEALRADAI